MFYSHNILQKRGGRFGIIWIAATKASTLTKREYVSVKIIDTCQDIVDYIMLRAEPLSSGNPQPRLSLYLSSQLMCGVVRVYKKQCEYLTSELINFHTKVRSGRFNIDLSAEIDLPPLPKSIKDRHALPEGRMSDPEFGTVRLSPLRAQPYIIPEEDVMMISPPAVSTDTSGAYSPVPSKNLMMDVPHLAPSPESIQLRESQSPVQTIQIPGGEVDLPAFDPGFEEALAKIQASLDSYQTAPMPVDDQATIQEYEKEDEGLWLIQEETGQLVLSPVHREKTQRTPKDKPEPLDLRSPELILPPDMTLSPHLPTIEELTSSSADEIPLAEIAARGPPQDVAAPQPDISPRPLLQDIATETDIVPPQEAPPQADISPRMPPQEVTSQAETSPRVPQQEVISQADISPGVPPQEVISQVDISPRVSPREVISQADISPRVPPQEVTSQADISPRVPPEEVISQVDISPRVPPQEVISQADISPGVPPQEIISQVDISPRVPPQEVISQADISPRVPPQEVISQADISPRVPPEEIISQVDISPRVPPQEVISQADISPRVPQQEVISQADISPRVPPEEVTPQIGKIIIPRLELTPIEVSPPVRRRGKKRRLLFADEDIQLRKEVIRQNLATSNQLCKTSDIIPTKSYPSATELFKLPTRVGIRKSEPLMDVWRKHAIPCDYESPTEPDHPIWSIYYLRDAVSSADDAKSPDINREVVSELSEMEGLRDAAQDSLTSRGVKFDVTPANLLSEISRLSEHSRDSIQLEAKSERNGRRLTTESIDEVPIELEMLEQLVEVDPIKEEVINVSDEYSVREGIEGEVTSDDHAEEGKGDRQPLSVSQETVLREISNLTSDGPTTFDELCPPGTYKQVAVKVFTVCIELIVLGIIKMSQKKFYGRILIERGPTF
ncbi:meiotic recombination protein REC8 homolog [Anneissia japonica]|uniref:meiotic recombination protein REC8 homolog n=1 Tax=Anneissia japonica TaxID=1529436 RepID=UPI001425A176|nr:meiotic recombination protein REC8 homolog [Anneissia japonica]